MLKQEEAVEALHDAIKSVDPPCTRFCRVGIEVEADGYLVFHNGAGHDTNVQRVYSSAVLAQSKAVLAPKLKSWVEAVHRGEAFDLNAATMSEQRGPAMTGWPWPPGEEKPW